VNSSCIRNFSIIAHVDHGKSTLADRLLERTGTIPARKMRDQVLDRMDLERERGITIKMTPVRMSYTLNLTTYHLNLIDTPGHIDFSYEVSRALGAVEGVLLLVDATQGIQAQTLSTLAAARAQGCAIIPVISKIDAPAARIPAARAALAELLKVPPEDVLGVSGKTGAGVDELLVALVQRIPPPQSRWKSDFHSNCGSRTSTSDEARGLIFDFSYSTHRGIVVYLRVFDGTFRARDRLRFHAARRTCTALEVGIFTPEETPSTALAEGEIGYIVTGIKEPGVVGVGDTIGLANGTLAALPGYQHPQPIVWASVYPESQDDFTALRHSLERLRLSDSSLSFEEELSGVLGRGFRCGFLGLLHLEIVTERLKRESKLSLIVTMPTISYEVTTARGGREVIYTPSKFPEYGLITAIEEPWVRVIIITPPESVGALVRLLHEHEATTVATETYQDNRVALTVEMPLRELMRGFFDTLKNISSGYASLSYELIGNRPADVVRLDVLVAEEPVPAFARVVARRRLEEDAEKMVDTLRALLPKQLFVTKIQARALGRIIASRTLPAARKDVTGYLYGGDVTRKKKLLEKQKRGKKRLLKHGTVEIPEEVFMKVMRSFS